MSDISRASAEQSDGITQISQAVGKADEVTQQNASAAEETAAASEELTSQAESLTAIVAELENVVDGGKERRGRMLSRT